MHRRSCIATLLLSACVAIAGCSGGGVAIRSGFPAQAAPPPVSAPPGAGQAGLSVSAGNGLALAIVLGLVIADSVYWASSRLQHAFGEAPAPGEQRPLLRPMDRGWVDRGP